MSNPQTSNHAALQKALYVLEVLKGLPAGEVIYQQVEQILVDFQENQSRIERTYHVISYALLDAYLQHLNPASPLYIQAKMLQRKLQPPLSISDLNQMRAQVDLYSDHILTMDKVDQKVLKKSLSSLLHLTDDSAEDKQESHPAPALSSEQDDQHITQSIDDDLQNTITKHQKIGVVLDLLATEMLELEQQEGIEPLRGRMTDLVKKLKNSQGDLVGNMKATVDFITNTANDRNKLDEELQRVRQLSMTDELTGLPNRRAFLDRLEKEIGRVNRHSESLSLTLIDLDDFKKVNDTYGHAVGDQVLKCYADDVFSLFRRYDLVARYGGEEFAILSPNTDMDGAISSLDKAMDRVKNLRCHFSDNSIDVPSFSGGIAIYREGENIDAFIERADQALYKAKSLGRNRIETSIL